MAFAHDIKGGIRIERDVWGEVWVHLGGGIGHRGKADLAHEVGDNEGGGSGFAHRTEDGGNGSSAILAEAGEVWAIQESLLHTNERQKG